MSSNATFESREGRLKCSSEELYDFATDIRNLEQFIPTGLVNNWIADSDSCSFSVSMAGDVNMKISEKEYCKKVVYSGKAQMTNDFSIELLIDGNDNVASRAKVTAAAQLNPMVKMIAGKYIESFLEKLIDEMEKFEGWKETK